MPRRHSLNSVEWLETVCHTGALCYRDARDAVDATHAFSGTMSPEARVVTQAFSGAVLPEAGGATKAFSGAMLPEVGGATQAF